MSKMADLDIEIRNLLLVGTNPVTIARMLEIPVSWVYETVVYDLEEDYTPYNTVNS